MTRDQLIALAAACPVSLQDAATALGYDLREELPNLRNVGGIMERHADLTGEWMAHMIAEITRLEEDLEDV